MRKCETCGHLAGAHALFVGHCHATDCKCQHMTGAGGSDGGGDEGGGL